MLVKDAAKSAAKRVTNSYWKQGVLPVDPFDIAARLGIHVIDQSLPQNVSGMLIKYPGADVEIVLEADDSEQRRRFTCAHELGHFMALQEGSSEDQDEFAIVEKRNGAKDVHEFYADEFAGNLLMPEPYITDAWNDSPEFDLAAKKVALAKLFEVSITAVDVRLKRIGLLS